MTHQADLAKVAQATPANHNPNPGEGDTWITTELTEHIEDMIKDPRMVGLASYLAHVKLFWTREIPTACAGGGFIFVNPDFWASLPPESRKTLTVHELDHIILNHIERSQGLDPYTFNEAADHVINLGIEEDGFTFVGMEDCMKDPQYHDMSSEQVYVKIYEKKPEDRKPPDLENHISTQDIKDLIEDVLGKQPGSKTVDQQIQDNKKKVEQTVNGIEAGTGNAGTAIMLDHTNNVIKPKTETYHKIFENYLTDPLSGGKRTFTRPNRRQSGMKSALRLPGLSRKFGKKNRLTHLVYALDVSGSISKPEAQQFHDSVRTIKELLNPTALTVLFFDTKLVLEKTFTDREPYDTIEVHAGGGTNLDPVYRRVRELDPEAVVIFTDLEVNIPQQPHWETIWLVPDNIRRDPPAYGETYYIPKHGE